MQITTLVYVLGKYQYSCKYETTTASFVIAW